MNMQMPTVKILEPVSSRNIQTKNGVQTVHEQKVQIESEQLRLRIDLRIDAPDKAYPVGKLYGWDVVEDLKAGTYGMELARRMTLRDLTEAPRAKAA